MNIKNYVLILLITEDFKEVLLIKRNKEPYKGKYNGIGGKIEPWEKDWLAAVREIYEETGLRLTHAPNKLLQLHIDNLIDEIYLTVFYKFVDKFEPIECNEGELVWMDTKKVMDINNEEMSGDGNLAYFLKFIENLNNK